MGRHEYIVDIDDSDPAVTRYWCGMMDGLAAAMIIVVVAVLACR